MKSPTLSPWMLELGIFRGLESLLNQWHGNETHMPVFPRGQHPQFKHPAIQEASQHMSKVDIDEAAKECQVMRVPGVVIKLFTYFEDKECNYDDIFFHLVSRFDKQLMPCSPSFAWTESTLELSLDPGDVYLIYRGLWVGRRISYEFPLWWLWAGKKHRWLRTYNKINPTFNWDSKEDHLTKHDPKLEASSFKRKQQKCIYIYIFIYIYTCIYTYPNDL